MWATADAAVDAASTQVVITAAVAFGAVAVVVAVIAGGATTLVLPLLVVATVGDTVYRIAVGVV